MSDPADTTTPPSPDPAPSPSIAPSNPTPSSTGLPSNVAAALACIPLAGGVIFYILEKQDQFVRYYAMQSIIFGGAWFLFNVVSMIMQFVLHVLPFIGVVLVPLWLFIAGLVHLGFLIVMIIAMIKALTGVRWDIPWIGPIARKQMGETM
jgi:uncharacterized membrane protein